MNFFLFIPILLALVLTRSYAAWGALLATFALFGFFRLQGKWRWGALLALLGAAGLWFWHESGTEKFAVMFDTAGQTSLHVRLQIWQVAFSLWQSAPWFGIGPGMFQLAYWQHAWEILGGAPLEWNILHTHNLYLQWLTELGVIGLALFVGWVVSLFSCRPLHQSADPRFALVLILIQGLLDLPFWKNDLSLEFFLLAGLVSAGYHLLHGRTQMPAPAPAGKHVLPTVQLDPRLASHLDGVYLAHVYWRGQTIPALVFAGKVTRQRKTERRFAVHFINLKTNLAGEWIELEVLQRFRSLENFPSRRALASAVQKDILRAQMILNLSKC